MILYTRDNLQYINNCIAKYTCNLEILLLARYILDDKNEKCPNYRTEKMLRQVDKISVSTCNVRGFSEPKEVYQTILKDVHNVQ